jgi:microsomal epoxide hydrolase
MRAWVFTVSVTVWEHMAEADGGTVNMMPTPDKPDVSTLSALEKKALDRATTWQQSGQAYAIEHATRPSTIGHVLSSNPLALLAW